MTFKTFHIDNPFFPLQGPNGVRPKAPAIGAWQSPGYTGLTRAEAQLRHKDVPVDWFGMRCDGLVVIDCDSEDAAVRWSKVDVQAPITWVRKTPRGFHFIYLQSAGSPDAPYAGVFPGIDIRAGRSSQIVYFAPQYKNLTDYKPRVFEPEWLPSDLSQSSSQLDRSDESWSEMPDGRGNNTMTAIAGAMRKQGMDVVTIAKCLGAINKITMTVDPMPTTMIVDIAKSVGRYKAKPDIDIEVVDE